MCVPQMEMFRAGGRCGVLPMEGNCNERDSGCATSFRVCRLDIEHSDGPADVFFGGNTAGKTATNPPLDMPAVETRRSHPYGGVSNGSSHGRGKSDPTPSLVGSAVSHANLHRLAAVRCLRQHVWRTMVRRLASVRWRDRRSIPYVASWTHQGSARAEGRFVLWR